MTLPPKPQYVVAVIHVVQGERHVVFARGDTEADALCKLAKRGPDGHGISSETFVAQETFIVPRREE